jgi:cytochrome c-type biogenesis protein
MIGQANYSLALVAGIFATFNPCGFAMLPAYLSFIILGGDPAKSKRQAYSDAIKFSVLMGTGILVVFSIFAAFVIPFASSIQRYLPILTIVIGFLLIIAATSLLSGRNILSAKLWSPSISPTGKLTTFFGYGVTFALGSISCTIGPFLAITNSALSSSNVIQIFLTYLAFGLGTSITIGVLALVTATSNHLLQSNIRKVSRGINIFSALILLLVGLYLLYFAWFELRLIDASDPSNAVLNAAFQVQGWIISRVDSVLRIIGLT